MKKISMLCMMSAFGMLCGMSQSVDTEVESLCREAISGEPSNRIRALMQQDLQQGFGVVFNSSVRQKADEIVAGLLPVSNFLSSKKLVCSKLRTAFPRLPEAMAAAQKSEVSQDDLRYAYDATAVGILAMSTVGASYLSAQKVQGPTDLFALSTILGNWLKG